MISVVVCIALPFYLALVWLIHRSLLRRVQLSAPAYWLLAFLAACLPLLVMALATAASVPPQYDGYCYVWADSSFPCSLPAALLVSAGFAVVWGLPLLFITVPFVTLVFALGWKP